ncbi:hypothetical protein XI03_06225 [Bradyrhizobium sp. CCBAU 65884]|uniref:hypothetical protein n=1 Tax=Bradyrhizobium sp. CCBAU 65884 TaxID=722477 RepID=UPI0023060D25|nr:hypothetical protein [Bradyrhizobium sp. CCBAU 65884]MDA9474115.1 hypothetical protein [Bradyrhizobium sp. CCBAU 65884]
MLMIIPYPTYFVMAVDEAMLRKASCQYEIPAGAPMDELIDVLSRNIIEYEIGPKPSVGLRLGVVFRSGGGKTMQEFYFNDSGGSFELLGYSNEHRMKALAHLPDELRALVMRLGAVPIKDALSKCLPS